MSYSIIGFGAVGQALASAFARQHLEVTVASRRKPETLAPQARGIGSTVVPGTLQDAIKADTLILAVPYATNAFGVPVEDLGGLPSSAVIAKAFSGAKLVKGFNHLPAAALAADPSLKGGRRVVFLSSDDDSAVAPVAALAERLGFAPIGLGRLNEGGALVQARGRTWAQLIFQDLIKLEK